MERPPVLDRHQVQVFIPDLAHPLQWLALGRHDRVDLGLGQHVERQPRVDGQKVRFDARRSKTLIAVTKVLESGKSTTTVLPSRSFMLRTVRGASTCISSLNILAT